jgi:hypothetical protein
LKIFRHAPHIHQRKNIFQHISQNDDYFFYLHFSSFFAFQQITTIWNVSGFKYQTERGVTWGDLQHALAVTMTNFIHRITGNDQCIKSEVSA